LQWQRQAMIALQSSDVRPCAGVSPSPTAFTPARRGGVDQVGVALRRANPGVAEEATDHFQRRTAGDQQGCEGAAEVMYANVGDLGDGCQSSWPLRPKS
jgi:hypothetical protein